MRIGAVELGGMPAAQELVAVRGGGWVTVVSGRVLLARFDDGDLGMRNTTIVSLRNAGFGGKQVAAAFGLTANSVSLLRRRARLEGSAGLVREMGRPSKISGAGEATAARMAAKGATQQQIAARLGVDRSTVSRLLARIVTPEPELDPEPEQLELIDEHNVELDGDDGDDGGGGGAEGGEHEVELMVGVRSCRYAGAALGLAFLDRIGFAGLFRGPGPPGVRLDSTAIATGTTLGLLLGASNLEGFKHLAHRDLGALVGIGRFASQRTLRARVAALGDTLDAIGLQTRLAKALLDLDRPAIEVFFVDDHFVTYSGGAPLGKGWNTKRRHAEPGHSDTWLADASGRPLICMSGEPTGLTAGLIQILQPLRHIVGDPARPLVAFDRGGSYPTAFKALHTAGFDWVAYRRGALTATTATPKRSWSQLEGTRRHYTAGDETIDLAGYGPARQITLYEHGDPAAQILTSVHAAVPARILYLLRCRWRIENTFKYLAEHHGIDSLCDYTKTVHTITRDIPNPQRATATTAVAAAETAVRDAKTRFADLIWQPWTDPITHLKEIGDARDNIEHTTDQLTATKTLLKTVPAKQPRQEPRARPRLERRALQTALRICAHNTEHWLAAQLDTYLQNPDEVRAITRALMHQPGTINYQPDTITVTIDQPDQPKITRALHALTQQLNTRPAHIPGDPRPLTYTINTNPNSHPTAHPLPEV